MKFNFYLANIGYEKASITELEEGFITLNKIAVTEAKPEDTFLKSKTCLRYYLVKIQSLKIKNFQNGYSLEC